MVEFELEGRARLDALSGDRLLCVIEVCPRSQRARLRDLQQKAPGRRLRGPARLRGGRDDFQNLLGVYGDFGAWRKKEEKELGGRGALAPWSWRAGALRRRRLEKLNAQLRDEA